MDTRSTSYIALGYSTADRVIANCDKASAHGDSPVIHSPWGVIKMYHTSSKGRGRFYSVSKSTVIHNGGSYKMSTLRDRIAKVSVRV